VLTGALRAAPHLLQNFEPGALATVHDGHTSSSLAPHSTQKNWFTEGFDTADLIDAKALLDALAR